jgi:hypothetical protein
MKKNALLLATCLLFSCKVFGQKDDLPVSGNVKIGTGINNSSLPIGLSWEIGGTSPLLQLDANFRFAGSNPSINTQYRGANFRIDTRTSFPLFQWFGRKQGQLTEDGLMTLTEDGRLGIGDFNPQYKLSVLGEVGGVNIYTNGHFHSSSDWGGMYVGANRFVGGAGDKIGFWANGKFGMVMNSAGGVFIGDQAEYKPMPAGFKLAVEGKIIAKEIKVSASLADYVFADGYQLRPLSEVAGYIKQHGHLPEIPSAAEVAKEGMNVGEMENLLLKKVEELTLYLIEVKEENARLQQQLARLSARSKPSRRAAR